MIKVNSVVKLDFAKLSKLTDAQATALEQTAEALHTEVVQAQVMPRDTGALQGERTFIKSGESVTTTYEDGSEVINSISKMENGRVVISTTAPQVRRLYYHPEYHFHKEPWEETWKDKDGKIHQIKHDGNPNAKGKWFEDWADGGKYEDFAQKAYAKLYRRIAGL